MPAVSATLVKSHLELQPDHYNGLMCCILATEADHEILFTVAQSPAGRGGVLEAVVMPYLTNSFVFSSRGYGQRKAAADQKPNSILPMMFRWISFDPA